MLRRLSVLMILATIITSFLLPLEACASFTSYTDPHGYFTFTIPDGYDTSPPSLQQSLPQFYSQAYSPATFTVSFEDTVPDAAIDSLTQTRLQTSLDKYRGATLTSSGIVETVIGGRTARWYEFVQAVGPSFRWQTRQYVVLEDRRVITISFSAFTKDFDAFLNETDIVLQSFEFLDASTSISSVSLSNGSQISFIRRLGEG